MTLQELMNADIERKRIEAQNYRNNCKARKWSYDDVVAELEYIQSLDCVHPGPEFNYERECLARYLTMQANHAEYSGFPLTANDIRQYRDIAERVDQYPA